MKPIPFTWNGKRYRSHVEASKALGITIEAIYWRKRRGYTCDADMVRGSYQVKPPMEYLDRREE